MRAIESSSRLCICLSKVILQKDSFLLGIFTFEDVRKLRMTCRLMYQVLDNAKALKKVVRYGNLNKELRGKYWESISE